MVEHGHVGVLFYGGCTQPFGGRNEAGPRGHFGAPSGLAFEGETHGDFAEFPVGAIENFQLQIVVLDGRGAIELDQVAGGKVLDQHRLDEQRRRAPVERHAAGDIGRRYLEAFAGRIEREDEPVGGLQLGDICHGLLEVVVVDDRGFGVGRLLSLVAANVAGQVAEGHVVVLRGGGRWPEERAQGQQQ